MRRVHPIRLAAAAGSQFLRDHGFSHAAAVAYFSLLSLPPFLYLAVTILERVLPERGSGEASIAALEGFLPSVAVPVFRTLVERLPQGDGLFWVALPALLWAATTAFSAFELAVNVAFGTAHRRRFWLSRLKAFVAVSGIAILLAASTLWNQVVPSLEGPGGAGASWLSAAAAFLTAYGGFVVLYKLLPRGRVSWGATARAAVPAVILWEGARLVFGGLLRRSPVFGLLTGTLAGVVTLLLWIYLAVALAIFGAEVAALLNGNRRPDAGPSAGDPYVP
jgi:YihY family inner membrane protein